MITREQALEILNTNLENRNLINHCLAVEAAMGALAKKLGGDEEKWRMAGLLHDADWEKTQSDPSQHTRKTLEWIDEAGGADDEVIECILTHNYEHNGHREPDSLMEWALFTCDELTGFIVAVALVRPEKKLEPVAVKSVLKKFPQKSFAKPVDREQIRMCEEKLNIPIDEFVQTVLDAMKGISDDIGL